MRPPVVVAAVVVAAAAAGVADRRRPSQWDSRRAAKVAADAVAHQPVRS